MAVTDHNFFDNFSDHLQSTVGQQVGVKFCSTTEKLRGILWR